MRDAGYTQIVPLDICHSAIYDSIWCPSRSVKKTKKISHLHPISFLQHPVSYGTHLDMCLLLLQHVRHISNKGLMVLMAGGGGLKRRSQLLGFGLGLIDLVLKSQCFFFTLLENMAKQIQVQIR